jgi:imidazolonepropionase-like amidohydrolase
MQPLGVYSVDKLMAETRRLAAEYRRATGQPLPVTAELARYDAARLLDLEVVTGPAQGGYDAVGRSGEREGRRILVKGRAIFDEGKGGQRIGQLKLEQPWDSVMLVLMDEELEAYAIYEAERADIEAALQEIEQSKRNKRGAMSVARFKIIARPAWTREEGPVDDEVWDNWGSP